jgi:RNA polymerase sigma-70 factor (ECF subfamily)
VLTDTETRARPRGLAAIVEDDAAFRQWYERCAPRVYAYVLSRSGSASLAEEITQAVFVEAVRRPWTYDGREDAVPWLCGIARHQLARHFRRGSRQLPWMTTPAVREIDVPGDAAWRSVEARDRIRVALGTLPSLQRAALIFRFLDGLSVREVAQLLHRTEDATESLLRRARENFSRAYRETSDDG